MKQGNCCDLMKFSSVLHVVVDELRRLESDVILLERAIESMLINPVDECHVDIYLSDPIRQRMEGIVFFLGSLTRQISCDSSFSIEKALLGVKMGDQYERFYLGAGAID